MTGAPAQAQVINESFTGTTMSSNWVVNGSGYTPTLTANNTSGIVDAAGSGYLELTNTAGNLATAAYYNQSFNSAGTTVYASFNYQSFGGTAGTTHGGDGLTFFLFDGSVPFSVGAYGGSIGYAQKTAAGGGGSDINGLSGGYLGVALDAYGNFSAGSEGRVGGLGGTTSPVTESIAVRGPGSGLNGYAFLGGSGTLATALDSTARPSITTTVQVLLSATNQLTVTLQQGGTSPQTVLQMDLSGYARPSTLKFGFAAGSGAATDNQLINNLVVSTIQASLWKNTAGDGNWMNNNNWNPTVVPTSGSDILLDNSSVSTAQTLNTGANQTIRSLTFDAPFNYTVNNNTLTFNSGTAGGFSGVAVTSTHGSGTFTVNSNLAASNAINIRNNSTSTLNVNGTVSLGANNLTLDGTGTNTTIAGVSSGTGAVVKNDTGTVNLSGANTYSGGTTLNLGTLNANNNTALGTGSVNLAGGTLASTSSATLANNLTLSANSGLSNINTSGTLTQTASSTLNMANVTHSGAVSLSNSATTGTLTVQVDTGSSTISGVIANGGTASSGNLTKTGGGTLVLSGADTYSGTTTISNGSLQLGASNVLNNASSVSIGASGTLNLNKFSQKIGSLTATGGATLDFGAGGTNTFVFGTYTPPSSGVLTVANWTSGSTILASTVGAQNVSSIYLSGYGTAAEAGTTSSTIYGNAYAITAAAQNWKYWDGSTTNWTTNGFWSSTASPTFTNTGTPNGVGVLADIGNFNTGVNATPTLQGNTTLGGLRFDSAATQTYTVSGNTRTLTMQQTTGPAFIQQQGSVAQNISVGTLALTSNTVLDTTGSGSLTINSVVSGAGSLTKTGTGGSAILYGANTYNGGTTINDGTLVAGNNTALGNTAGAVTVSSSATLALTQTAGAANITVANAVNINGAGVGNNGALQNLTGSNTLTGVVTENGDSTISAASGTTLNLTNTAGNGLTGTNTNTTFAGTGTVNVNKITTGTGGVIVNGGNVNFNGTTNANTYTGATTVNSGTLTLNKSAGTNAVAGNLNINGGTVALSASNQIADSSTVTMAGSGILNLNGNSETVTAVNGTSGSSSLTLGAGALTISGAGNASSNYAGAITGTSGSSLNLTGTGTTYLSGNSSAFAGSINISNGTLNASGSNSVLGTGAVNVTSQGNLQAQGGISLANNLNISSTGPNGNGAIENISGANNFSGTVTVNGSSRINSDNGTLGLTNTVAMGTNTLTFGGSGNTTLSGALTGSGSLTKDGSGTLTLSHASNTFSGSTTVSAGTLNIAAANALNNSASLSIATGGTVNLSDVAATVGPLSGTGNINFGTIGSLTLSSGTSTFAGSFSGAGTLIIGSGATFTLGAGFNDANLNIVLAGGTLNLNGTTSTFGNLSVTANSVIDFGAASNSVITVNNVTASAGATLAVNNWTNLSDYFYSNNSPGTQGTAPINQVVFNTYTGANTKWISYDHEVSPVPEPSTYGALFMAGLLGGGWWMRRRRAQR